MSFNKGILTIMGSGELTATMVEVHKSLLNRFAQPAQAVFLDTPAGFQLNADEISQKASVYFKKHVGSNMAIASYKHAQSTSPIEAQKSFEILRQADYILFGPGSPTYTVNQLTQSMIPKIFSQNIEQGKCVTAASAAALTLGRFTLPVYEIYKVGQDLFWHPGLDILREFGLDLVVIPHWNNAEGGTHDTRFCYMGQHRFDRLCELLPKDVFILGVDEHTACIIDFENKTVDIKGIGHVTLKHSDRQWVLENKKQYPLDMLNRQDSKPVVSTPKDPSPPLLSEPGVPSSGFWDKVLDIENRFTQYLEQHQFENATRAILDMDRVAWQATRDLEDDVAITQARETFRDMIVLLGNTLVTSAIDVKALILPMVEDLIDIRNRLRSKKDWQLADDLRAALAQIGVVLKDTDQKTIWELDSQS